MENTQIILNALITTLMFAFALLILFDFSAGLINLWDSQNQHLISSSSQSKIEENPTLPLAFFAAEILSQHLRSLIPLTAKTQYYV